MIRNTRHFVETLQKENELCIIEDEIDPHLDLAEIQRQVVAQKGPALLFTNVKGTPFPVATNLYGSQKRIDLAFGQKPVQIIERAVGLMHDLPPTPKK